MTPRDLAGDRIIIIIRRRRRRRRRRKKKKKEKKKKMKIQNILPNTILNICISENSRTS